MYLRLWPNKKFIFQRHVYFFTPFREVWVWEVLLANVRNWKNSVAYWSEVWTHRRCGQTGPADGLRAGVQRSVFGFVEEGMHIERLLAVHRHHDCRSEGGSLSVYFVRLRFGCFLKKRLREEGTCQTQRVWMKSRLWSVSQVQSG